MRRPHRRWVQRAAALAILAGAASTAPAAAQQTSAEEVRLLREASLLEAAGELGDAEARLREILDERATSVPALLSLERIHRVQGRLEDLVPLVRSALREEPRSALLNQLLVRTYSALDRVGELSAAAEAWTAAVPGIEIPYREVAQIWVARGDYVRARATLEEGRRRLGRPDALALELGDLYADLRETDAAVREWDRALGPEARGLNQVRRRLRSLPDGGAAVLPRLVSLLAAEPATPARLRAAVDLAVDAGLEDRALSVARRVAEATPASELEAFLIDVARRADGGRLNRLSYWAYGALAESEQEDGRLLAIQNRLAELALELGDTASAAARYSAVESAYARGTPQRRQAAALRIELMAAQDVEQAATALREFRSEYAGAAEADRLTAAVAGALVEADRRETAEQLLAGVRGPRSALLRGRLALERGEVDEARLAMMSAVPDLRGSEATAVLSRVTVLSRLDVPAGRLVGEALGLQDRGEPGLAVDRLERGLAALRPEDRPPVLEFAAGTAEAAGLVDDARRLRRRITAEFPRANEAPAALLALARSLRSEQGGTGEARELLERLILEYPRSALVPQARRELQQLEHAGMAGTEAKGAVDG